MKKGCLRFAVALLTISMISTMSLSAFAAKVIKPSSRQNDQTTEEQSETTKKSEEPGSVSSAKSSLPFTPKTHKVGKLQIQTPKNWGSSGDESALLIFSPISTTSTTMMGAIIYDSEEFYSDSEDAALSSLNQSYISGVLGVLSKQIQGKSQSESKALLNEYLQQFAQEGQTIELVSHKTHPGIKVTMEEPDDTKGQVIMLIGTEEVILLFGMSDTAKSYDSVVSTLNAIVSTVKTVK